MKRSRLRNQRAWVMAAFALLAGLASATRESRAAEPVLMPLGPAWAANSVNTTVFRNDPITTHADQQYAAYYDANGKVVIATRTIGQKEWKTTSTNLTGNIKDAHNGISIIADGAGYLHVSWDHHNHPLRYVRSKSPGSVELTDKMPMTGENEKTVSYPQFFALPDGNLIFFYREGASGRGNLALNHYDAKAQKWTQVHANLISGENKRNAYPQSCVDAKGSIHVSWVWRDSPDVATNHDLCYARSDDGGKTWKKSDGSAYALPITAATAEIASPVPQKHELINQTSMCADEQGRPVIATYFRPQGQQVPQYFVIHHDGRAWKTVQATQRKTPFSLSGGGSKAIPISRPQVFATSAGGKTSVGMIFRDAERDSRVSLAHCPDLSAPQWNVRDLTDFTVQFWEPSYDHVRWTRDGVLNLYVQRSGQGDAETLQAVEPQTAQVLEWKP
ncbi:MAG TPA: BNR repeat-containing protein [Tepidisphaeraceae bacterium]|nr:BNR repeat-containing protein [Tepidisphaeraceae bacterium]